MKPEIINGIFAVSGAIIGALTAGLFNRNIARKNKDKKEITNFKIDESDYEIRMDDNLVEIRLSFINAMDEINFILLTDTETDIDIKFRQPEIRSLIKGGCNPETPGVLISAFYDAFESSSLLRAYFKLVVPGFHNYLKLKKEKFTPYNKV